MNLRKFAVKRKVVQNRGSVKGITVVCHFDCDTNTFFCTIDDKRYTIDTSNLLKRNVKTLYALPTNNAYEAWTKKKSPQKDLSDLDKRVWNVWSLIKDGHKVRGEIVNDKFVLL